MLSGLGMDSADGLGCLSVAIPLAVRLGCIAWDSSTSSAKGSDRLLEARERAACQRSSVQDRRRSNDTAQIVIKAAGRSRKSLPEPIATPQVRWRPAPDSSPKPETHGTVAKTDRQDLHNHQRPELDRIAIEVPEHCRWGHRR